MRATQYVCTECNYQANPRPDIRICLRGLRKTVHSEKSLLNKSSIGHWEDSLVSKGLAMQTLRPELHHCKQCVKILIQLQTLIIPMLERWTQVDPKGLIDQPSLISNRNEILSKEIFAGVFNHQLGIA